MLLGTRKQEFFRERECIAYVLCMTKGMQRMEREYTQDDTLHLGRGNFVVRKTLQKKTPQNLVLFPCCMVWGDQKKKRLKIAKPAKRSQNGPRLMNFLPLKYQQNGQLLIVSSEIITFVHRKKPFWFLENFGVGTDFFFFCNLRLTAKFSKFG